MKRSENVGKSSARPLRFLTQAGLIGGMYAALCLALAPISYGPLQVRVAEILTVLPAFTPAAIPGLTVGCLIANLFGGGVAGSWDWLFGTLTTLAAAAATWGMRHIRWKNLPIPGTLPPVVFNAAVVGLECAVAGSDGFSLPLFLLCAAQVFIGQLIACTFGGTLLAAALTRTGADKKLLRQ